MKSKSIINSEIEINKDLRQLNGENHIIGKVKKNQDVNKR
jgi:hypothetical protein